MYTKIKTKRIEKSKPDVQTYTFSEVKNNKGVFAKASAPTIPKLLSFGRSNINGEANTAVLYIMGGTVMTADNSWGKTYENKFVKVEDVELTLTVTEDGNKL